MLPHKRCSLTVMAQLSGVPRFGWIEIDIGLLVVCWYFMQVYDAGLGAEVASPSHAGSTPSTQSAPVTAVVAAAAADLYQLA